jgi:hypothetical protein
MIGSCCLPRILTVFISYRTSKSEYMSASLLHIAFISWAKNLTCLTRKCHVRYQLSSRPYIISHREYSDASFTYTHIFPRALGPIKPTMGQSNPHKCACVLPSCICKTSNGKRMYSTRTCYTIYTASSLFLNLLQPLNDKTTFRNSMDI